MKIPKDYDTKQVIKTFTQLLKNPIQTKSINSINKDIKCLYSKYKITQKFLLYNIK